MAYQAKNGVLPKSGGWLDQTRRVSQAIDYAQNLIRKQERGKVGNLASLFEILGV